MKTDDGRTHGSKAGSGTGQPWTPAIYSNPNTQRHLRLGIMGGMGDRATARYSFFWLARGVWQGTFPGRDQDFVSFLVAYARTNPRLTRFQRQRDSVAPGSLGIQTFEGIVEID